MLSLPIKVDLESCEVNGVLDSSGYLYLDASGLSRVVVSHEFPMYNEPVPCFNLKGYDFWPVGLGGVFELDYHWNTETAGNVTNARYMLNMFQNCGGIPDPTIGGNVRDYFGNTTVNALNYLYDRRYVGMAGILHAINNYGLHTTVAKELSHIPIMSFWSPVCRVDVGAAGVKGLKEACKNPGNITFGYLLSECSAKNLYAKGWEGLTHKFRTWSQKQARVLAIADVLKNHNVGLYFPDLKDPTSDMTNKLREYFDKYAFRNTTKGDKKLLLLTGDDITNVYMNFGCNSCMTGVIPRECWDEVGAPKTKEFQDHIRTESYAISPNAEIALLIEGDKEDEVRKLLANCGKSKALKTTSRLNEGNMILARTMVWTGRDGKKYHDRLYPSNSLTGMLGTTAMNKLQALMKEQDISQLREGDVTAGGSFKAKHYIECDLKITKIGDEFFTLPYMDTMRWGVLIDDDTLRVSVNEPKNVESWQVYSVANSKCVHRIMKAFTCPITGKKGRTGVDSKKIKLAKIKNQTLTFEEVHVHTSCVGKEVVQLARSYGEGELYARKEQVTSSRIQKVNFIVDHMPEGVIWLIHSGVAARPKDTIQAIVSIDAAGRCVYGMERRDLITDMYGKKMYDQNNDKECKKMTHEPEGDIILSIAVTPEQFAKSAKGRALATV